MKKDNRLNKTLLLQWGVFIIVLVLPIIMVHFEPEMTLRVIGMGLQDTSFVLLIILILLVMIKLFVKRKDLAKEWRKTFVFIFVTSGILIYFYTESIVLYYKGLPTYLSEKELETVNGVLVRQSSGIHSKATHRTLYLDDGEISYSYNLPRSTKVGKEYRLTLYPGTNWVIEAELINNN